MWGAHASRTTFVAGNSALGAARKIRQRLLDIAAETLQAHVDDLVLRDRTVFVKGKPESQVPIAKLLRNSHFKHGGQMMMADYFYDPANENMGKDFRGKCRPPIHLAPTAYG